MRLVLVTRDPYTSLATPATGHDDWQDGDGSQPGSAFKCYIKRPPFGFLYTRVPFFPFFRKAAESSFPLRGVRPAPPGWESRLKPPSVSPREGLYPSQTMAVKLRTIQKGEHKRESNRRCPATHAWLNEGG